MKEDIDVVTSSSDNMYHMLNYIFETLNIKSIIFLYIIYILLSSNIFSKYILEEKIDNNNIIDKKMLIKGIYLVVIFMLIQILIKLNIL
jgi:hypothetical protein